MSHRGQWLAWFGLGMLIAGVAMWLVYQLPPVKQRLEWRLDAAGGIVRGWIRPAQTLPTPVGGADTSPQMHWPTSTPRPTVTADPQATPTAIPTPLPSTVHLPAPAWEKQDWNNCGPATLALAMRYFGWEGDQHDISDLLKPDRGDKNVNPEELAYFVRTRAGWLNAEYRVGGDLETLKRFLAAGYPVVVEKDLILPESEGGGGWAAHYALLTGYDDAAGTFITQDTYRGADLPVSYSELEQRWHPFNHVYMVVYPADQGEAIYRLMGEHADPEVNRQIALEDSLAEVGEHAEDPYAWFNLGTNLAYFERYGEAAQAFDTSLQIGLPWRFTRYQFGPYIAYFHQGRFEDVLELADATLFRTQKAEESLLWRGWARFRLGQVDLALQDFRQALAVNPNYLDAQYAVDYVLGAN
jgi:tetratricopeptide (TPR) repeat protein